LEKKNYEEVDKGEINNQENSRENIDQEIVLLNTTTSKY
jgi:hypothetical protein